MEVKGWWEDKVEQFGRRMKATFGSPGVQRRVKCTTHSEIESIFECDLLIILRRLSEKDNEIGSTRKILSFSKSDDLKTDKSKLGENLFWDRKIMLNGRL